MINFDIRAP